MFLFGKTDKNEKHKFQGSGMLKFYSIFTGVTAMSTEKHQTLIMQAGVLNLRNVML